jgi:hypothetical protein
MKPLLTVKAVRIVDVNEGIPHKRRESLSGSEGGLPDGGYHGLLLLSVPLYGDSQKARSESRLEDAEQEANSPYTPHVLRKSEREDELLVNY